MSKDRFTEEFKIAAARQGLSTVVLLQRLLLAWAYRRVAYIDC